MKNQLLKTKPLLQNTELSAQLWIVSHSIVCLASINFGLHNSAKSTIFHMNLLLHLGFAAEGMAMWPPY